MFLEFGQHFQIQKNLDCAMLNEHRRSYTTDVLNNLPWLRFT